MMTHAINERRSLNSRIGDLVWRSDTHPTRFSLAIAALILSIASWTSGTDCQYVGCVYLELVAPWQWWATAWGLYAVLMLWRVFEAESRTQIAIIVNGLGAFLFCSATIVLVMARWPFMTLSAPSITLAGAALWVFMRTGIHSGSGCRGD